jgi:hypothetical protein
VSRFSDYDDYDDYETWALNRGRWEHNSRVALKGKRGRQALRDLREALMALPEHKLIEGAMCTVGAGKRKAALVAGAQSQPTPWEQVAAAEAIGDLDRHLEQDGEGVCGIGAYVWYQKVKAGMDPQEAFDSLPSVLDGEDGDSLDWTARLGEEAGLTFTLAWNLAYRNDQTYQYSDDKRRVRMTPEQRWEHFIRWIDKELSAVTQ